jgi:hypothetical protein
VRSGFGEGYQNPLDPKQIRADAMRNHWNRFVAKSAITIVIGLFQNFPLGMPILSKLPQSLWIGFWTLFNPQKRVGGIRDARLRVPCCVAWISLAAFCFGQSPSTVALAWDANAEPDLAGYRVHYGTASGNYINVLDVGNQPTATISGLTGQGTFYFIVTAYNIDGIESLPSNELSFTPTETGTLVGQSVEPDSSNQNGPIIATQSLPDGSFSFTVKGPAGGAASIYTSSDLEAWQLLANLGNPTGTLDVMAIETTNSARRFYRVTTQ